jgi:phosphatidylinositol alpha 1,6-mannosyltransferase
LGIRSPLWRNVTSVLNPGGPIVHISDCYAPRTGGIETQVANLVAAQRNAGLWAEVVTATVGPSSDGVTRVTFPVPFELPVHPRARLQLVEHLAATQPSVLHIHLGATSPFAWGAIRAAREMKLPTVITVHSMWGGIARLGYHTFARQFTGSHFVWSAVSREAAQGVQDALNVHVHTMPNGIDVAQWRSDTSQSDPSQSDPSQSDHLRLVGVLRMAPRKRVGSWLSIVREVQKVRPETTAVLVGDGPLLSHARRYVNRHQLKVTLPGRLSHSQLRDVYAESDVFLQSSIKESFGIAALEARAAGLVVIARMGTGTGSFISQGVNGFLEPDDRQLVRRVIELANDPLQVKLIKDNNQVVPIYDLGRMLIESLELYRLAQQS